MSGLNVKSLRKPDDTVTLPRAIQGVVEMEAGPDEAYEIPPGHDAYVVGDEPLVQIEWQGLRTFLGSRGGIRGRRLTTLLFTDLVESTSTASDLGDRNGERCFLATFSLLETSSTGSEAVR